MFIGLFILASFFTCLFLCFVLFWFVLVLSYFIISPLLSGYLCFNERIINSVEMHVHRWEGGKFWEELGVRGLLSEYTVLKIYFQ